LAAESSEERLHEILTEDGLSISTAESCTGGLVSHRITSISGSSAYFLGGVVAYSNGVKMSLLDVPEAVLKRVGAVSSETALAMARGVRRRVGADIGVSTTGIAGPGGATATKPVGLVFIACSTPWGDMCEEHHFSGDRIAVIEASADAALTLALEQISKRTSNEND
jgi:PncC family amidohydrolase